jgi:hypothetical protein
MADLWPPSSTAKLTKRFLTIVGDGQTGLASAGDDHIEPHVILTDHVYGRAVFLLRNSVIFSAITFDLVHCR